MRFGSHLGRLVPGIDMDINEIQSAIGACQYGRARRTARVAVIGLEAGKWLIVPAILLSAILNAVYFGRVLELCWFDTDHHQGSLETGRFHGLKEAHPLLTIPPFLLVSLSIVFGIAAFVPLSIARKAAAMLLGG